MVVANIERKDKQHQEMSASMMKLMSGLIQKSVFGAKIEKASYPAKTKMSIPGWLK